MILERVRRHIQEHTIQVTIILLAIATILNAISSMIHMYTPNIHHVHTVDTTTH